MSYYEKLKHPRWQRKRLEILNRDNFKCTRCNSSELTLHVHHIKYFKGEPWDTPNEYLTTLCFLCHKLEEGLKDAPQDLLKAFDSNGWSNENMYALSLLIETNEIHPKEIVYIIYALNNFQGKYEEIIKNLRDFDKQ